MHAKRDLKFVTEEELLNTDKYPDDCEDNEDPRKESLSKRLSSHKMGPAFIQSLLH